MRPAGHQVARGFPSHLSLPEATNCHTADTSEHEVGQIYIPPANRVLPDERITLQPLREDCLRIILRYGFKEEVDVPKALELCAARGVEFDMMQTSFFLSREKVLPAARGGMRPWRERLFAAMVRNAGSIVDYFNIPPNRVIELGTQVEISPAPAAQVASVRQSSEAARASSE